jgi:hypothetical protein
MTKSLLECGAKVSVESIKKAIDNKNPKILELLLDNTNMDINTIFKFDSPFYRNMTFLSYAILRNDDNGIKLLLDKGASLDKKITQIDHSGSEEMSFSKLSVRSFLKMNKQGLKIDTIKYTKAFSKKEIALLELEKAVKNGNILKIKTYPKDNVNVHEISGFLLNAISSKRVETVKALIDIGAYVTPDTLVFAMQVDSKPEMLSLLAQSGKEAITKLTSPKGIAQSGGTIDYTTTTPLEFAQSKGRNSIEARILLNEISKQPKINNNNSYSNRERF